MGSPHNIDPRAHDDPRNRYPTDEQFYASDRPAGSAIPEDRPRGGAPAEPVKNRGPWAMAGLIVGICLLILLGIALFP
jgi:hypothetical protein